MGRSTEAVTTISERVERATRVQTWAAVAASGTIAVVALIALAGG